MNDFTKEELEYIMHLWHVCNSYHNSPSQDFKKKIQSIIDNYCEHEWTNKSIGITVAPSWPDECVKCGKVRV